MGGNFVSSYVSVLQRSCQRTTCVGDDQDWFVTLDNEAEVELIIPPHSLLNKWDCLQQ